MFGEVHKIPFGRSYLRSSDDQRPCVHFDIEVRLFYKIDAQLTTMSSAAQLPYVPRIFVVRLEVSCCQLLLVAAKVFLFHRSCSSLCFPHFLFRVSQNPSSLPFLFIFTSSRSCSGNLQPGFWSITEKFE